MSKQYRCCVDYVDIRNDDHIEESTILHVSAIQRVSNSDSPLWVFFVEAVQPIPLEAFKFCFEEDGDE